MRYWIFGIFALVAACEMTPEQREHWSTFNADWTCAHATQRTELGSPSFGERYEWCKKMRMGQPYTPIQNAVPIVREQPPTYHCSKIGNTVACNPR